jgi:hypothetical protein
MHVIQRRPKRLVDLLKIDVRGVAVKEEEVCPPICRSAELACVTSFTSIEN